MALDRVLMLVDNQDVTVGTPFVEGVHVMATVKSHERADKIVVFKYKNKVRYRRKLGHRQPYTEITIDKIFRPEQRIEITESGEIFAPAASDENSALSAGKETENGS